MMKSKIAFALLFAVTARLSAAFAPLNDAASARPKGSCLSMSKEQGGGVFGAIGNFFEELDAFVDDATSRRLGAGSNFYGKRKSNFYGESDKGRKKDRSTPDPSEDYQGPSQAGYFKWMMDEETGQMKPVTRMKERNIERNPNFWDRAFKNDE
eukprot:CAMPEP_0183307694 /NCGR_PEP_ID=MMETSP0160_2-20130417/18736_1 /TAXON_ID=2839 ORGANISM="Odontella Sinensis, Strain Grunow 1884" /NCGR_SAMPLE_ID=MMETSP0160_2 /ASSEMBLY_ACC=CAM_ASM_000250 /LENGTH=152 /DNA_ID=CAMNT_0025471335 /DNA_START=104 /DNA_END=562 /DNA_ORIENTATION=+